MDLDLPSIIYRSPFWPSKSLHWHLIAVAWIYPNLTLIAFAGFFWILLQDWAVLHLLKPELQFLFESELVTRNSVTWSLKIRFSFGRGLPFWYEFCVQRLTDIGSLDPWLVSLDENLLVISSGWFRAPDCTWMFGLKRLDVTGSLHYSGQPKVGVIYWTYHLAGQHVE